MSAATIAIIVVVVAVVVLVTAAIATARRRRLQRRFGPEYDRVVEEKHGQLKAEAELAGRQRRVQRLDIRPLSAAAGAKYAAEWEAAQERFVDQPRHAVAEARLLVVAVMKERGYPAEDHDQIAADLSVEHAVALEHYRAALQITANAETGDAPTEDLRQAMVHYRAVFSELLGQQDEAVPDGPGTPPVGTGIAGAGKASTSTAASGAPTAQAAAAAPPAGPSADDSMAYEADNSRTSQTAQETPAPGPEAEEYPAFGSPADEPGDATASRTRRR
jgi:hypothetical protein